MTPLKLTSFLSVFLLAASLIPATRADVIIGNLADYTNDSGSSGNGSPINYSSGNYSWKAIGFTMGAADYDITSLTLRLKNVGTTTPTVDIFASSGGVPGAKLYTFTDPTFDGSNAAENYVFTAPADALLSANTTYYIVVRQLSTSGTDLSFNWLLGSSSVTPLSSVGATATTGYYGSSSPNPATSSGRGTSSAYNWFELDGTAAIPEPAACAAMLGVIAGLAVCARRFRRRG